MSEAGDELGLGAGPWVDDGLDDVATRLEHTLRKVQAGGAAVSFDVGAPGPERDLMVALLAPSGAVALSFSLGADELEPRDQGEIARFFAKLVEQASSAARIETKARGRIVARTTVGVAGDIASVITVACPSEHLEHHMKSLDGALRSRRSRMRLLLATLQVATKIAAATGTGNPLLAVPAAWRFIRGVMAEWEQRERAA